MFKQILLAAFCAPCLAAAFFNLACGRLPLPWVEVGELLDEAACTLRIVEATNQATATAEISTGGGQPVELANGQSLLVNGQPVAPADGAGQYAVTVPVANEYKVTVIEPTRGVADTTQAAPPDFTITAPNPGGTVSLAGFTVTTSNSDPALSVSYRLVQSLFGAQEELVVPPAADTGGKSFAAKDLADFRQGADLSIIVTKISRRDDIAGFESGQITVERSRTVTAKPGP